MTYNFGGVYNNPSSPYQFSGVTPVYNIAFDSAAAGTLVGSGTSATWAHTISASLPHPILWVGAFGNTLAAGDISGATYNGVAMTPVDSIQVNADRWIYLFVLVNPATGTNNVVLSASTTIAMQGLSTSYVGVRQSGQPDAFNTGTSGASIVSSLTTSVITVANNCWSVVLCKGSTGSTLTAGTGTTQREFSNFFLGDSNGPITPAGSYSMQVNNAGSDYMAAIVASFSPG